MWAKTREADTVLAVQNNFENYSQPFWKKIFILMSFFFERINLDILWRPAPFNKATSCEMSLFQMFLISLPSPLPDNFLRITLLFAGRAVCLNRGYAAQLAF